MWTEITKASDWPGIGRGYNIRIEGMKHPTTAYINSVEELEKAVDRVKKDFFDPNLLMMEEIY